MWSTRLPLYSLIITSVFVALLLDIYPLPFEYRIFRPQFSLMVAIYWIYVLPQSTRMSWLFFLGVIQDILDGSPIGQHVLALLFVTYISLRSCQRVRHFALWQKTLWVFVLVSVAQLINYWVQSFAGREIQGLGFLVSAASSACLWPFLYSLLGMLRRRYRILRES